MNPTEDEILKALNNSGYLFEQEIGSIFERYSYHIQTNAAFEDDDEEKSREIDVTGYQRFYYNEEKMTSIGVRIICECKNSQTPFVFINRNKSASDSYYCPPNFLFPQKKFMTPIEGRPDMYTEKPAFRHFSLDEIFPYSISDTKAVQFCKMVRKGKEWEALHDGIYDNILIPIIKCLEYYKRKDSETLVSEWKNYSIYFPIVVLNSKIYVVDSHIDATKVKEVSYISFTREIDSKKIKGKYLVDFVTKDGLENYLQNHLYSFVEGYIMKIVK